MAYNTKNIIVGAASVHLSVLDSTEEDWTGVGGELGPSLPAFVASTKYAETLTAATTDWRHAGFTQEGVEVSYEPDYGDVEVDQQLDSAKVFKQSMRVMVNTTFAEASLENLLVVWGQPGRSYRTPDKDAPYDEDFEGVAVPAGEDVLGLESGELGDDPTERAIAFVGPAPRTPAGAARERVYHVRRAISVESSAHALRRNEATVFPVSFRILPDPAKTGAQYGTIRSRVIG